MSFAPLSFGVITTLAAYRVVKNHTVGNQVVYSDTITAFPIGITSDEVDDTNQAIPVIIGGLAKLTFNDSVAVGGLVAADSSGRGIPYVGLTAGSYAIGILVGPKVNETGSIAEVLFQPQHFKLT